MAMFKAFKPSGMEKIARAMGYSGNMQGFQDYLAQDPMRQQQMQTYQQKAMQMAKGGVVRMQTGGMPTYVNPITPKPTADMPFGPAGAAVMQYGYNPTTNQYSISGGGGQQFSEGFESSMNYEDLYRKYPNIRGAFEQGVPKSNYPQKGFADEQAMMQQGVGKSSGTTIDGLFANSADPALDYFGRTYDTVTQIGGPVTSQPMTPELMVQRARASLMQGIVRPKEESEYLQHVIDTGGKPTMSPPPREKTLRGQGFSKQPITQPAANTGTVAQGLLPDVRDGSLQPPNNLAQALPAQQQQADTPTAAAQTPATPNLTQATIGQMYQPALPTGAVTQAAATPLAQEQMIDPGTGTVTGAVSVPTAIAGTAMATPVQEQQAAQMQAAQAAPAVDSALASTQAAQGTVDPRAEVLAAQQTASSVGNVTAAQGQAVLIDNPVQREIQAGELISGAAADATKAAQFTEQVQAAEATPSDQATVQGQLAQLTANFDANNPPAWAAGALRNATAQMAARGLGASSLAGQAIVQATLESALPIAQADASIVASFEQQNLTNRQQRAMLAAQQRAQFMGQEFDQAFQAKVANAAKISDIANQNFTAEQQVQLENSRAANTMNLNNLSNKQALVMSEAAALAQLDTQNLNNHQQAAVQNAQNFLQMDMQNLSNQQQTEMFKAQQRTQALFTDQAATNAAAQFNATSENQVTQFFANLANQVSQFNATQANAQAQFNAGQVNTVERFNAELNNQRDQFNATNQLAIAQSNAVWRREIATADTAAINRANELNANAVLDMSKTAYDNLWTYYADTMEWAWESAENELDRYTDMAIAQLSADTKKEVQDMAGDSAAGSAIGGLIGTLGSAYISKIF